MTKYQEINNYLNRVNEIERITRNQKSDGVYTNYSRKLADLLITE